MNPVFWNAVWLLWPIILAVGFLTGSFLPRAVLERAVIFKLPLEFLSLEGPLAVRVARAVFVVAALLSFCYPAFRDYSHFFPDRLKMVVYYDDEGVLTTLDGFNRAYLRKLNIPDNWQDAKKQYFVTLNKDLGKEKIMFQFDTKRGWMYSAGETIFKVKMIDRFGVQNYWIEDAHGTLAHFLSKPLIPEEKIYSEFELVNSEARNIRADIMDVYWRFEILITPEFKQSIRLSQSRELYHHILVAATQVRFFPYIDIGRTLYLVRQPNGTEVPIGYAVYQSG